MHTALPVKALDRGSYLAARQLLDGLFQLRVTLAKTLIQLRRVHSSFLKLREGAASFHPLMLTSISD
jgi:hypothetical protein